jgi:hypothetical protein
MPAQRPTPPPTKAGWDEVPQEGQPVEDKLNPLPADEAVDAATELVHHMDKETNTPVLVGTSKLHGRLGEVIDIMLAFMPMCDDAASLNGFFKQNTAAMNLLKKEDAEGYNKVLDAFKERKFKLSGAT